MPGPIYWKSKTILVKPEGAYAVDPNPTGALNAVLLTDVQFQPMEGEDVSRNLEQPYMGGQEQVPVGLRGILTGSFELQGSGTPGKAPAWGPLLRSCGVAQIVTADTSVEYVPISEGHESFASYFHLGPSRHVLLGSRSTGVITMNAQGIPVCRVTMTGLFSMPSDTARPNPTLTDWQRPDVVTKANTPVFTIGGKTFKLRSYELNLGVDVQPRMLANDESILIVDRAESLTTTVEAVPYAEFNPYDVAMKGLRQEIVIQHGKTAGKIVTITTPTSTLRRPSGVQNQQGVVEWPLAFNPLPNAGNDQFKIKLT